VSGLFRFEDEFGDGLRCVPMAVRIRLDRAGVKLDLKAWVKFTEDERRGLLDFAGDDRAFGERVSSLSGRGPAPARGRSRCRAPSPGTPRPRPRT
jgi:hypothetical protein